MPTDQPRVMEIPGIPGKVQEMTLDQYMAALSPGHLARKQLDDIRAMALEAMNTTQQLVKAFEKIEKLEKELAEHKALESDCSTVVDPPPPVPTSKAEELYKQ